MTSNNYLYGMETPKKIMGRPAIDPATRKRNRAISLTDAQYAQLKELAHHAKTAGVSSYIVKVLGLA